MLRQHHVHLVSTYTTVLQHLAEIRQVATVGRSPSGSRLTPLPPPMQGELLAALEKISTELAEVVRTYVPDWQRQVRRTAGIAATRMWVNVLLRRVEELVRDLQPGRMSRQYGAVEEEAARGLQRQVDSVLASLQRALLVTADGGNRSAQPP